MQYSLMGFLLDCALAARSWSRYASTSHIRRRQGEKYPLQHGTPSNHRTHSAALFTRRTACLLLRRCVVASYASRLPLRLICVVLSCWERNWGKGEWEKGKGKGNEYLRSVSVSGFIRRGPNQQSAMQLQLRLDDGAFQGLLHASCKSPPLSTPASDVLMPAANEYLPRYSDDDEGIFRLCDHKN